MTPSRLLTRTLARIWVTAGFLFLPLPILVVVASSFSASGVLQFPPRALSWRWYEAVLGSAKWMHGIGVSLLLATVVALVTTTIAVSAAHARHRLRTPALAAFDALVQSPLLFPHAAIGIALLGALAAIGWIGTYPGLAAAHVLLCLPFAYRPVLTAYRRMDPAMQEAAMSLGARPLYALRRIILPLLRPGIAAGFLFSFMISLDEVSVSMFLAGPNATTLPVLVFTEIQESGTPAVAAVSSGLVLLTMFLFAAVDRLVGIELFLDGGRHS